MLRNSIAFLLLIASVSLYSQEWKQQNEQTKVTFKIKNIGFNVKGSLKDIKVSTNINVNSLAISYLNATIPVNSISTGIETRDKHLLTQEYFNESNFKDIVLKSTKIKKLTEGQYHLSGTLKIKEITNKIETLLYIDQTSNTIGITSNFSINRKDFNIGGGSFILSKTVQIQVEYLGIK